MKQIDVFDYYKMGDLRRKYGRSVHGGTGSTGRRKEQRPLSSKKWIHLVLKSHRAKGQWSFLSAKNRIMIDSLVAEKAQKFGVRVAEFVNVGNHLHLKIRVSRREHFQSFLRAISCLIARKVTGARRGSAIGKFWSGLAFTRILHTAYEELLLGGYLRANKIEAGGSFQAREKYLERFNRWAYRLRYAEP